MNADEKDQEIERLQSALRGAFTRIDELEFKLAKTTHDVAHANSVMNKARELSAKCKAPNEYAVRSMRTISQKLESEFRFADPDRIASALKELALDVERQMVEIEQLEKQ